MSRCRDVTERLETWLEAGYSGSGWTHFSQPAAGCSKPLKHVSSKLNSSISRLSEQQGIQGACCLRSSTVDLPCLPCDTCAVHIDGTAALGASAAVLHAIALESRVRAVHVDFCYFVLFSGCMIQYPSRKRFLPCTRR